MMTAGGKVFLAGLLIAAAGAVWLVATSQIPRSLTALEREPRVAPLAAGLLVATIGCFLYVLLPQTQKQSYATLRTVGAMLITAVTVANIISFPAVVLRGARLDSLGLAYVIAASELPILAVVWLRLVKPGCLSWREIGWHWQPFIEHIQRGLLGGVGLFLSAAAVGAVLTRLGVHQNQFERFEGIQGTPLPQFLAAVAAGCILAPLVEETFFRGYVFQTFAQRYGRPIGYAFSAALFALVHANLAAAVPIFVLGLMLAYIFDRTGSIVPGAIAHGVNNAISFWLLYSGLGG